MRETLKQKLDRREAEGETERIQRQTPSESERDSQIDRDRHRVSQRETVR